MNSGDGILLIDKPGGLTSHDVVRKLRRILKIKRIGHAGTLDPMATGLLVVGVGLGTRLIQFLMSEDKTYLAKVRLGITTDTQDAEGEVVGEKDWRPVRETDVRRQLERLVGWQKQQPPMFSALKVKGVPLYRFARKGIELERKSRSINVSRIELSRLDLPDIDLLIECSKGTYVRTLAYDLGENLGCGAHLAGLRRLASGSFSVEESTTLEEVQAAVAGQGRIPGFLSLGEALRGTPHLEVEREAARRLEDGISPDLMDVSGEFPHRDGSRVALVQNGKLLAVACFRPLASEQKRGDFELLRVFPQSRAA